MKAAKPAANPIAIALLETCLFVSSMVWTYRWITLDWRLYDCTTRTADRLSLAAWLAPAFKVSAPTVTPI